jgi:hypothetical protein
VGTEWVTQNALDTFNAAITAAEAVSQNAAAVQAAVDAAATTLNGAVAVFNEAKQAGTKTDAADKTALNTAIATATAVKSGVVVNTNAANVPAGTEWVTQDVMNALNTAIAAAQTVAQNVDATQSEADIAATNLNDAVAAFNEAKQTGTQPQGQASVTISVINGTVSIAGDQGTNIIKKGGDPDSLVLRATGFTDLHWSIDSSSTPLTANPLVLNAAYYDTRKHSVTFYGVKDGRNYSRIVNFTVEEEPGIARVGPVSAANLAEALKWLPEGTAEAPSIVALDSTVDINSGIWGTTIAPALAGVTKHIVLDLSACSATGNTISGGLPPAANDDFNIITNTNYRVTGVILPASLETIGTYAFANWTSLGNVVLPNGLTAIGEKAFYYCTGLAGIALPEGLQSIGYYAFQSCASLGSITIPASVTSIADRAFWDCTSLVRVTFEGNSAVVGGLDSFPNSFWAFYEDQSTKAGTYVYSAGSWRKE